MGVAWMVGGTAGEGLETAGEAFARALASAGYRPSTQRDFPSRIRGGDTTATVRVTPEGYLAPAPHIDLALAFNETVCARMDAKLGPGSLLLVDDGIQFVSTHEVASFPFRQTAKDLGEPRAMNMVALGASAFLMAVPRDVVAKAVELMFAHKPSVVESNLQALDAGMDLAKERFGEPRFPVPEASPEPLLWLSGNEAASLGALAAGCRVAAAYPITPASDVLEFLTPRLHEIGGVALQVEDEIAALNMCLGANFAGARSITATSGPGLSLMTETIGLAGATETPAVILNCQRPGPATGMPTKHAQEDLWHMAHGGHGEFPRAVIAPTCVADAYHATIEAFRLAETWRCPVIVAMDSQMDLFKQAITPPDVEVPWTRTPNPHPDGLDSWSGFEPYGSAERVGIPGEPGGRFYANSTEHGPSGFTNEDPAVRDGMLARRAKRLESIRADAHDPVVVFEPPTRTTDATIVAWGSTVEAAREAGQSLGARVIAVRLIWPFPAAAFEAALGDGPILVAEANATGQLARLIQSELPLHGRIRKVLRNDGTPVRATDIVEAA